MNQQLHASIVVLGWWTAALQDAPLTGDLVCLTRGHVVRDGDGAVVSGATVTPKGFRTDSRFATTNAAGRFELPDGPRCKETQASWNRGLDYLQVSAPGYGVAFVDPCSRAPWAEPVRLRAGAAITGTVQGHGTARITVTAPISELCWPPRTGLTVEDKSWRVQTDAQGQFEIVDLPAQVPLVVQLDVGDTGFDARIVLALSPGERRDVDLVSAIGTDTLSERARGSDASDRWIPVAATVADFDGQPPAPWFEFVRGGRLIRHRNGGGRWHVHHHRACSHLEITPGPSTIVARRADGSIGMETLDVTGAQTLVQPCVTLSPGALLRIDGSALEGPAHLALSSNGVEFVDVELIPGTVRYEVVPAGTVEMRVAIEGREPDTREITPPPGAILDVEL